MEGSYLEQARSRSASAPPPWSPLFSLVPGSSVRPARTWADRPASRRRRPRPPRRRHRRPGIGGAVARIPSAADPELHLATARDFAVVPRGMDRSKRRPSPGRMARPPIPFDDPYDDRLYHPTLTDHLFLVIASQPIGDSTPEDWIVEQMAEWADWRCTATEPIAVGERIRTDRVRGLRPRGRHNRWPRLLDLAPQVQTTIQPPSLPTTGRGSRRSLPPCNCIPRTPSMWRRPRRPDSIARPRSRTPYRSIQPTILIDARAALDGRPLSRLDRDRTTAHEFEQFGFPDRSYLSRSRCVGVRLPDGSRARKVGP